MLNVPKKRRLLKSSWRDWENHPVTVALRELCHNMFYEAVANGIRTTDLRKTVDTVALNTARLKGRQEILEYLFRKAEIDDELLIKVLLDDIVEWED